MVSEAHAGCAGSVITVADLRFDSSGRDAQTIAPLPSAPQVPLEERLQQVEREQLVLALERANGNKQLAAELLGIPRASSTADWRRMDSSREMRARHRNIWEDSSAADAEIPMNLARWKLWHFPEDAVVT